MHVFVCSVYQSATICDDCNACFFVKGGQLRWASFAYSGSLPLYLLIQNNMFLAHLENKLSPSLSLCLSRPTCLCRQNSDESVWPSEAGRRTQRRQGQLTVVLARSSTSSSAASPAGPSRASDRKWDSCGGCTCHVTADNMADTGGARARAPVDSDATSGFERSFVNRDSFPTCRVSRYNN